MPRIAGSTRLCLFSDDATADLTEKQLSSGLASLSVAPQNEVDDIQSNSLIERFQARSLKAKPCELNRNIDKVKAKPCEGNTGKHCQAYDRKS